MAKSMEGSGKGRDHYGSPDYDNGTGPEKKDVSQDEVESGRSNPNSPYYENGTGPRRSEEADAGDDENDDSNPSNPNSPNYEG